VRAGKVAPRILITSDAWEQDPASPALPPPGPKRDAALPGLKGYAVRYGLFPEETHETGIPAASTRGLVFALTP
jgi:hypothetical protein